MIILSSSTNIISYLIENSTYIFQEFAKHLYLSLIGVGFSIIVGVPLGIWISEKKRLAGIVIGIINVIQTVPSFAMLSILMIVLGLGDNTVIATIFLYALLPIVKNTYVGLDSVDPHFIDCGRGVGMSRFQVLRIVKFPIALPIILAGIRNALVISVGVTAIGSFVGAGGLGDIILRGTNTTNGTPIIIVGSFFTALIAVFFDVSLGKLEEK